MHAHDILVGGAPHHPAAVVLQGWANEKATGGRIKLSMLPKHPLAPPGLRRSKDQPVDPSVTDGVRASPVNVPAPEPPPRASPD